MRYIIKELKEFVTTRKYKLELIHVPLSSLRDQMHWCCVLKRVFDDQEVLRDIFNNFPNDLDFRCFFVFYVTIYPYLRKLYCLLIIISILLVLVC